MKFYPVLSQNSKVFLYPNNQISIQLSNLCVPRNKSFINLTNEAWETLRYCDGKNSFESVLKTLQKEYEINQDELSSFYEEMKRAQVLTFSSSPVESSFAVYGNGKNYFPRQVSFRVTELCNLDCSYCYMGGSNHQSKFSKFSDMQKILDILIKNHVQIIELTGGEPMIHPEIYEIIRYSLENFEFLSIITNGVCLGDNVLEMLTDFKTKLNIQVSIDGSTEVISDKMRGRKKTHYKTINTIEKLIKNKIPFRIATVLTEENAYDLENMIISMKRLGVTKITYSIAEQLGNSEHNFCHPYSLRKEMLKKYGNYLDEISVRYSDVVNVEIRDLEEALIPSLRNCGAGFKTVVVDHLGNVFPCVLLNDKIQKLGNVLSDNYYEIFNTSATSKVFQKFDLKSSEDSSCTLCEFNDYCSSCFARVYISNKSLVRNKKESCPIWDSLEAQQILMK